MSALDPGAPRAHPSTRTPVFAAALLVAACSAPAPEPLDLERVATDVTLRIATPEQVRAALELADLRPLSMPRPVLLDEPDYDRGDFWHASALAFNGGLRSARRRFAEAAARSRSAGAPGPIELQAEQTGFGSDDGTTWLALTFDVLGLLDAGRSEAARDLARAEARAAWADVEGAAWAAHIAVDRARTELGDSLSKADELTRLLDAARPSVQRAELLATRGRLAPGELSRLRGMVGEVEHQLHLELQHVAWHRRELADAAGLPPHAPALGAPTRATLDALLSSVEALRRAGAYELLEHSPALRRMRLEYALAEAMLRDEVARTRPGLRLGPALEIQPDDILPGGVLALDLPFPGAFAGRVEAALQARERAREELEDRLRGGLARLEEARAQYRTARMALDAHVGQRVFDTERAWRAAQASFLVDPAAAEQVGMALRDRAMALLDLFDVRHEVLLAWLDHEEVLGPVAAPATLGEPGAGSAADAPESEVRP